MGNYPDQGFKICQRGRQRGKNQPSAVLTFRLSRFASPPQGNLIRQRFICMASLHGSSAWLICTGIRIAFLIEQFHPPLLINSVKMTGSSLENKNNILFFSHLHTFIYIIYIIIIIIFIYKIKIKRKCKK